VEAPAASPEANRPAVLPHEKAPAIARLLLVEDNLVNQKVVMAILRKKGYQIDVANEGREALTKLEGSAQDYDVVLMDIQMPVMDGLETTRAIRRNPRWSSLPIVAMTAHAMNGDRERCLQAGMNSYVSKPIQPAHLISTIEKHLTESISGQEPPPANEIERGLTDRLMQEDSGMALDLLQVFLQLAPERLERLESAVQRQDITTLAAEARKIAGAADLLASRQLGECAQRIERAAKIGDFNSVTAELETLRREIDSLDALAAKTPASSGAPR
jgi:CheY-like chemotaxis protein